MFDLLPIKRSPADCHLNNINYNYMYKKHFKIEVNNKKIIKLKKSYSNPL
jgi:hypothetical protein